MTTVSFTPLPTQESTSTSHSSSALLQELDLEGEISVPIKTDENENSTLDEPIAETVMRDARAIGSKFKLVFLPRQSKQQLLKEWDLWGPLVICLVLACFMQGTDSSSSSSSSEYPEFADIFVIFWIGAVLNTVNSKLLGGRLSFFQCVCVLGYCVLPLAISLILCRVVILTTSHVPKLGFAIRLISVVAALGWSTFASVVFLAESMPPAKKALGLYPMFLFYAMIGWLVIART